MQSAITVLVTGFEPFGGDNINPSLELARKLHKRNIGPATVYGVQLPVLFYKASAWVIEAVESIRPDIVLSLGLNTHQSGLAIERIAMNLRDGGPDNGGVRLEDVPITADGPAAYFATIPVKTVVKALKHSSIPARISNTAGTFCCNEVMYTVLHHVASHQLEVQCGFVHVPRLPVQAVRSTGARCMELGMMVQGIETCIAAVTQEYIQRHRNRYPRPRRQQALLERPLLYSARDRST